MPFITLFPIHSYPSSSSLPSFHLHTTSLHDISITVLRNPTVYRRSAPRAFITHLCQGLRASPPLSSSSHSIYCPPNQPSRGDPLIAETYSVVVPKAGIYTLSTLSCVLYLFKTGATVSGDRTLYLSTTCHPQSTIKTKPLLNCFSSSRLPCH